MRKAVKTGWLGLLALTPVATASAASVDKAPAVAYDPYRKSLTVTGVQHLHNALLNQNKTTWWLGGAIVAGVAHNPTLIFNVDMPGWAFIDSAADSDGGSLLVHPLNRNLSNVIPGDVNELVAVEIPIAYLEAHRAGGLNIKLMGKGGEFVVVAPAQSVDVFMTSYDAEISKAGAGPTPVRP